MPKEERKRKGSDKMSTPTNANKKRRNRNRNRNKDGAPSQPGAAGPSGQQQQHQQRPPQQHQQVRHASTNLAPPSTDKYKSRTSKTTISQMTATRFDSLTNIHATVRQAIAEKLGYEFMTKVQEQTVPVTTSGLNVVAKAKTGSGKTISFLLPAIEVAMNAGLNKTSCLILSPTRELAQQIEEEAQQLLSSFPMKTRLKTACFVGGIKINKDFDKLRRSTINIIIATPGRLNDHLQNHGLDRTLSDLKILIFDEADRLLDMGFKPEILQILGKLPRTPRQTLLFSATFPASVKAITELAMQQEKYTMVDTIGEEESTHEHIEQSYTVITIHNGINAMLHLLHSEIQKNPENFKVIVFFPTARMTQFYAELFNLLLPSPILEMHSRKPQGYRTKTSERFREGSKLIMFSSDVSARGMDYPDVTKVMQFGLPSDREQYIHRLGRTGRGDSQVRGTGHLLLHDFEQKFLRSIKDLPIKEEKYVASTESAEADAVNKALTKVPPRSFATGYQSWLGYYLSNMKKLSIRDRAELVEVANEWVCDVLGLPEQPSLLAKTVGKMQLKGVPGVIIDRSGGGGGSGRGGGGRRGGGGGRGGGRSGGRGRGGGGGGSGRSNW